MANFPEESMQRIARLETNVDDLKGAVVHIVNLLIDQGERMDARFERMDARFERMDARFERIETRMESMDARLEGLGVGLQAVTERLDRLITVSIQERTFGIERLAELERRLARLEAHTGIDS